MCDGAGGGYHLYGHKGLNYSIFKGEDQIAAISRNSVKVGKGDVYEIRMNDDADIVIVICMTLAMDNAENDDDDATITYDVGQIGPEARPFDKAWEPS